MEDGTYYLRNRVYQPSTGRFISEDTVRAKRLNLFSINSINQNIKLVGGYYREDDEYEYWIDDPLSLNLYTYTQNNPVNYIDPSGNIPVAAAPAIAPIAEYIAAALSGVAAAAYSSWIKSPAGKEAQSQTLNAINNSIDSVKSGVNTIKNSITDNIFNSKKTANDPTQQVEQKIQQRETKKPISGSGKEKADDVPSWAKGNKPYVDENGKDFAKRLCDQKYGIGNYDTGTNSDYNKIKKWGDRGFK